MCSDYDIILSNMSEIANHAHVLDSWILLSNAMVAVGQKNYIFLYTILRSLLHVLILSHVASREDFYLDS
jgi:hypothetical protein